MEHIFKSKSLLPYFPPAAKAMRQTRLVQAGSWLTATQPRVSQRPRVSWCLTCWQPSFLQLCHSIHPGVSPVAQHVPLNKHGSISSHCPWEVQVRVEYEGRQPQTALLHIVQRGGLFYVCKVIKKYSWLFVLHKGKKKKCKLFLLETLECQNYTFAIFRQLTWRSQHLYS